MKNKNIKNIVFCFVLVMALVCHAPLCGAIKITPEVSRTKTSEKKLTNIFKECLDKTGCFKYRESAKWFYFDRIGAYEDRFVPAFKKSKFFPDSVYSFAGYSGCICNPYYHVLIAEPAQQKKLVQELLADELKMLAPIAGTFDGLIDVFGKLALDQQKLARQEIIDGLACRYKIHIQVKPEYCDSVTRIFIQMFSEDRFDFITGFKVTKKYMRGYNYFNADGTVPACPVPIMVLYVALVPGIKEEKNARLNNYVHALETIFTKKDTKKIALPIAPRYNLKINDLMYIAGGEGWNKKIYLNRGCKDALSHIFTEELVFFKGYELEYKPALR
ncbi:MAG: hypothetical protein ABH827_05440 [bacterium]